MRRLWAILRELAHPFTTSLIVEAGAEADAVADAMRVISAREVAPNVYEIVTESARYGRVTQRVLVLPRGD